MALHVVGVCINRIGTEPSRQPAAEQTSEARAAQSDFSAGPDYGFNLESLSVDQLRGWCVDKRDPARIFDIDLLIDGVFFRTMRNGGRRPDLEKLGWSAGFGGLNQTGFAGDN
jgi:hypothetical protein